MIANSQARTAEEQIIRSRLRTVARPDSRFQLDLDCFIPDYPDSADAAARIRDDARYQQSQLVFATPDNALLNARGMLLRDGKRLIVPSYGLSQGFLMVDPGQIPQDALPYAAWLDGVQHFGRVMTLAELSRLPPIDFCVVGAAAVARNGTRFGMGHHYFDIEWGLLAGAGLISKDAPVIVPVHDCQISDELIAPGHAHVGATLIVTPSREIMVPDMAMPRPSRLDMAILSPELTDVTLVREYRSLAAQN